MSTFNGPEINSVTCPTLNRKKILKIYFLFIGGGECTTFYTFISKMNIGTK